MSHVREGLDPVFIVFAMVMPRSRSVKVSSWDPGELCFAFRQSREGSPDRSESNENDRLANDQAIDEALKKLIAQQKQLKEQSDRIEQIPGVPPIIKGIDMDKYLQQPWKTSVAPLPILKKFKMPDIPKYDGTTYPRDHVTAFTTGVKGNDLTKTAIKSQVLADFVEDFSQGIQLEAEKQLQILNGSNPGTWILFTDGSSNVKGAGLELTRELRIEHVVIKSYSQLVVNQMHGTYTAREVRMEQYLEKDWDLYLIKTNYNNLTWDWRNEIVNFLQHGISYKDKKKAQALRKKDARYCLNQGNLYRKMFGGPLARCLRPSQTEYVMREIHEGHCENHAGGRSLVKTMIRVGYYWSKIEEDAENVVAKCDKCQRYGNNIHRPAELLHSIVAPWPFMKWGMDILREKEVRDFIWQNIICRFGVPKEIVYDNGLQFIGAQITEFFQSLRIKRITSTPYHLVGNGQAESTNKVIIKNLNRLKESKGNWPEIGELSTRYIQATEESNEEEMQVNLDLLEERMENALIRMVAQKQVIEWYYNRKARLRYFKIGDYILKKVFQSTREANAGKLSPTWEGPYKVHGITGKGAYELETLDDKILPSNCNDVHLKRYYF
uniref:Integrase catalytic domain-containing protein n=1 Tax=Nicotiana tabacum TaxID=4097 RepID=A0A1S4CWM7_TOBAC|nr:PREDICTED: uncharacterized protein LOC107823410 [Nicotiana tabacum]